jgi:redox-sensitive bicupin YhaK (pirin superfamily)
VKLLTGERIVREQRIPMTIRTIHKMFRSHPTMEVQVSLVYRAFGLPHVPELNPFLLLDEFTSDNLEDHLPGFPFHTHRGIHHHLCSSWESGTRDSLGNSKTIREGDVQWMTAGSGIIHRGMPKADKRGYCRVVGFGQTCQRQIK